MPMRRSFSTPRRHSSSRRVRSTPKPSRPAGKLADGYYLYRDKFKFSLDGARLGAAQYPAGKIKDDPTFGSVEVYKKTVSIRLPVARDPGGALPVDLEATFQGCAEDGVCYMPITSTASLKLAALTTPAAVAEPQQSAAPAGGAASALDSLRTLAGNDGMGELLPPEEAFKADARIKDAQTLAVSYVIAKDYYLYRDKLKFVVKSPEGVTTGNIVTPAPDVKEDPTFGRTEVFHKDFTAEVALSRPLKDGEELVVEAQHQGCSELGVCYPPATRAFTLTASGEAASETVSSLPDTDAVSADDAGSIERSLNRGGLWVAIVAFFGFGLALSLTPCVFPMIPILSGIIAGQKNVTHASGFFLSLAYVLGMAITYAIIGVIAAQSGTLLSNALQNPVALGIGAAIFVRAGAVDVRLL